MHTILSIALELPEDYLKNIHTYDTKSEVASCLILTRSIPHTYYELGPPPLHEVWQVHALGERQARTLGPRAHRPRIIHATLPAARRGVADQEPHDGRVEVGEAPGRDPDRQHVRRAQPFDGRICQKHDSPVSTSRFTIELMAKERLVQGVCSTQRPATRRSSRVAVLLAVCFSAACLLLSSHVAIQPA